MAQALEPAPTRGGTRLREGVAKARQISLEDAERRHGRKSSANRFDGYKRHLARDIDEQLILAAETLPANPPDTAGLDHLLVAVELQRREVTSLPIDRRYLGGELITVSAQAGVGIVCKPWPVRNPAGHFSKLDFQIDLATLQATGPAGQVIPIAPGKTAHFPTDGCRECARRDQGTARACGGRTLTIHPQEDRLQRLSVLPTTAEGRAALRERVAVEHSLAPVSQRQGHRARYNGTRKNTCHLRLVSAIQNLERAQALSEQAQSDEIPHRLAA